MSEYAADQVRRALAAGPAEGEDFFRLKVGQSPHVNVTPQEVALIGCILGNDGKILDEDEQNLLKQMIADYFEGLSNSDLEEGEYEELSERCTEIEQKLGLK